MLGLHARGTRLCDGLTRREWLRVGGLGALGLSLPALLEARVEAAASSQARPSARPRRAFCSFTWAGRRSTKPGTPSMTRPSKSAASCKSIASNVPGIRVGELMPRTAQLLDRICVLRAVSTDDNAHSSSGYWMLTGVPHQPTNSENAKPGAPNDWPCTAAIVHQLRRGKNGLPSAITLPEHIWNTGMIFWPGQDGGFLGRAADPWLIHCDPSSPDFSDSRTQLLRGGAAARLNGSAVAAGAGQSPPRRRRPQRGDGAFRSSQPAGVRSAARRQGAARLRSGPRAGGAARPLWPQPLGAERAAGAAAGRGRRLAGAGQLDAHARRHQRQPRLGHAQQERSSASRTT